MSEILRFRLTAHEPQAAAFLAHLRGDDAVEHLVDAAELMGGMHEDSSSAGLPDDEGPSQRNIEVHLVDDAADEDEERIRRRVDMAATASGVAVEYVDEF